MRRHGHRIDVDAHVVQLCLEWYASAIVSCYFALIISASSFVHAAASFVENEDNTPQIPCYTYMAVKKREGWHIKKGSTCTSLNMSLILSLFFIFWGKWALKAFSQRRPLFRPLNDNLGLWTCLRRLSCDPYCCWMKLMYRMTWQVSRYTSRQRDKALSWGKSNRAWKRQRLHTVAKW